jgi:hypothetical protein
MAMSMCSPSPALQYPDSDVEPENGTTVFANDDNEEDHEDEMVVKHLRIWNDL